MTAVKARDGSRGGRTPARWLGIARILRVGRILRIARIARIAGIAGIARIAGIAGIARIAGIAGIARIVTVLGVAATASAAPHAATASAAPRATPRRPAPAQSPRTAPAATASTSAAAAQPAARAELAQLDKDTTGLQLKQANFAAVKLARKALALQIKLTGPASIEVERRKQTLAGMLGMIGDFRGQLALDQELLALAEQQHGAESREVLTALSALIGPYWAARPLRRARARSLQRDARDHPASSTARHSQAYARPAVAVRARCSTRATSTRPRSRSTSRASRSRRRWAKDDSQLLGAVQTLGQRVLADQPAAEGDRAVRPRAQRSAEKPGIR